MRNTLSVAICTSVLWCGPIEGQVRLILEASDGRPIPSVQIDVWGSTERLGTYATDGDGLVLLEAEALEGARRVSFTHLGFVTRLASPDELQGRSTFRLEPRPIEIAALTVSIDADPCTRPPDTEGRRIWEAAASRYAKDTGTLETRATQLSAFGMRRETELFDVHESRLDSSSAYWAPAAWPPEPGEFRLLEEIVRRQGYAWEPLSWRAGARHLNWAYPQLEGRHAYHFVTETFGDLHDFRITSRDSTGTVVAFCPSGSQGEVPGLKGSVTVSANGMLESAEWRFSGASPDEGAGGEALFATFVEPGKTLPHLVPVRGIFFRHDGREPRFPNLPRDYYRELRVNTSWRVAPDSRR